jgi:hypothetical protein
MIGSLYSAVLVFDASRVMAGAAVSLVSEVVIIGVCGLAFKAMICASVLNIWILRNERLSKVAGLRVVAIAGLLRLYGPQGQTVHCATRQGITAIVDILEKVASKAATPEPIAVEVVQRRASRTASPEPVPSEPTQRTLIEGVINEP